MGLKVKRGKTEIYWWAIQAPSETDRVHWCGDAICIHPPVFRYLGHTLAHSEWTSQAQYMFLDECLPQNTWEAMVLVNTVLTPRWTYQTMLIPGDKIFKTADQLSKEFVTKCKGLEAVQHTTEIPAPGKEGCMGLYQMFWSFLNPVCDRHAAITP